MTTPLPAVVRYEFVDWAVFTSGLSGWKPLPVEEVRASADWDRTPLIIAEIITGPVDGATWAALDPRRGARVRGRIRQLDMAGTELGALPWSPYPPGGLPMILQVRTVTRDHVTGKITIRAAGRESLLADKRRISGDPVDTGAATVYSLTLWSLYDVFGGAAFIADPATSEPIPAGERRLMNPGESHEDLLLPELDAIGCRILDGWGRTWSVTKRDAVEPTGLTLSTYAEGANPDADPAVVAATETISRDDTWADGILMKYQPPGGDITYQRSGAGVNTRGLVVTRDRAAPAGNVADEVAGRAVARGYDVEVTARIRFDLTLGKYNNPTPQQIVIDTPEDDSAIVATIRAVEWDTDTGLMTIRANTEDSL